MVLGHELAHTILDHTGDSLQTAGMVAAVQVALLTALDPTGFLIFLFELIGMSWITR
jgi:Zn-dependent protease with chaperone function